MFGCCLFEACSILMVEREGEWIHERDEEDKSWDELGEEKLRTGCIVRERRRRRRRRRVAEIRKL